MPGSKEEMNQEGEKKTKQENQVKEIEGEIEWKQKWGQH
jgi:hypothetical protein